MKIRVATLATALVMVVATGCVSLGDPYQAVEDIPDGKALVYVYRPSSFVGGGVFYTVHADEHPVVKLYNGGYRAYLSDPGETEFWAKTESRASVTENLKAGSTYYLRGGVSIGVLLGRPQLEWVSEGQAQGEIAGCKEVPKKE